MIILFYILISIVTYGIMEGITWFVHKYIMHGFLWVLHEDHHQPRYQNTFEKNDAFFIAIGILSYGITYFIVHDVLIHQRFKWFKHTKNKYLLGLRKAHKIHHKHLNKEDGECFGMLNVPKKYFKKPIIKL